MTSSPLWTSKHLFGADFQSDKDSWLGMIIRKDLAEINMLLPEAQHSACLLMEMGEFICRASDVVAQLAHRLAYGEHINTYVKLKINQMGAQSDLSELGDLDSITARHISIRNLASKLDLTSKEIRTSWQDNMASSPVESEVRATAGGSTTLLTTQEPYHEEAQPHARLQQAEAEWFPSDGTSADEPSEDPDAETEHPIDAVIESLLADKNQRGKGQYYCPYRDTCMKGGVNDDGSLVIFERNSAFRAHLEKHLKRYKCYLPGCPSKSGFSRYDLLRRHQIVVPHNPV